MKARAEEVSEEERMRVVMTGKVDWTNGIVVSFFFFFLWNFGFFGIDDLSDFLLILNGGMLVERYTSNILFMRKDKKSRSIRSTIVRRGGETLNLP